MLERVSIGFLCHIPDLVNFSFGLRHFLVHVALFDIFFDNFSKIRICRILLVLKFFEGVLTVDSSVTVNLKAIIIECFAFEAVCVLFFYQMRHYIYIEIWFTFVLQKLLFVPVKNN